MSVKAFPPAMAGDLVDRLRGKYPIGPEMPNGEPEFGTIRGEVRPGEDLHDLLDELQHPPPRISWLTFTLAALQALLWTLQ